MYELNLLTVKLSFLLVVTKNCMEEICSSVLLFSVLNCKDDITLVDCIRRIDSSTYRWLLLQKLR